MRDEAGQVDYVCREVLDAREAGTALKAQAVLFRAAHHSGPLEVELTRRNIPFVKFGGLKFLDAAHVKDLLACLRFAQNPADRVAGFRVLQLLPGIGPATAEAVLDAMAAAPRAGAARSPRAPVPTRAAADWAAFAALYAGAARRRAPAGRRSSRRCAPGTSRTSSGCTRTPRCAAPTSSSSRRSPRATPAASAS